MCPGRYNDDRRNPERSRSRSPSVLSDADVTDDTSGLVQFERGDVLYERCTFSPFICVTTRRVSVNVPMRQYNQQLLHGAVLKYLSPSAQRHHAKLKHLRGLSEYVLVTFDNQTLRISQPVLFLIKPVLQRSVIFIHVS